MIRAKATNWGRPCLFKIVTSGLVKCSKMVINEMNTYFIINLRGFNRKWIMKHLDPPKNPQTERFCTILAEDKSINVK